MSLTDGAGGQGDNGWVWRDGREDDAAGTDLRADADSDIVEDFRARADQHATADFGVAVAGLLPRSAEGDVLPHGPL